MNADWILAYRSAELTSFFKYCPILASGTFFVIIIAIGFWRYPKSLLFPDLVVLIPFSTVINCTLKNIFQIPRPPVELHLVPVFDPFGMPSGDTQVCTVFWLSCGLASSSRIVRAICLSLIGVVAVSRVYLGVHSLADVAAGFAVGATIVCGWRTYRTILWGWIFSSSYWVFFAGTALVLLGSGYLHALTPMPFMSLGTLFGLGLFRSALQKPREPFSLCACGVSLVGLIGLSKTISFVPHIPHIITIYLFCLYAVLAACIIDIFPRIAQSVGKCSVLCRKP